jgi:hypothetical protein
MEWITHQSPKQRGYGSTSSPRNDSLKHTRKHERRREESNQRAKQPGSGGPSAGQGGLSAMAARTVRQGTADCPHPCPDCPAWAADRPLKRTEPPEPTREKRTVREDRADRPREPWTISYWSSDRPQTGYNEKLKPNRIESKAEQEHEEHAKNTIHANRTPGPCGPSARHEQNWKLLDPESQHSQSITGSP